jgi:hypothetical protein
MRHTLLMLSVLLFAGACGDKDDTAAETGDSAETERFSCGSSGGSCAVDEVCLINGACSACMALATECADDATCACELASDKTGWEMPCTDDSATCQESSTGGVTVTCPSDDWDCG